VLPNRRPTQLQRSSSASESTQAFRHQQNLRPGPGPSKGDLYEATCSPPQRLGSAVHVAFLAPTPAHAGVDECSGLGTAWLPYPFSVPPNWRTSTFNFIINDAVCASGATTITAFGPVSGACFSSSGVGVATVPHPHAFPRDHKAAATRSHTTAAPVRQTRTRSTRSTAARSTEAFLVRQEGAAPAAPSSRPVSTTTNAVLSLVTAVTRSHKLLYTFATLTGEVPRSILLRVAPDAFHE